MAQTFNMGRYVPPDLEGTLSGNQLQKKRAPGNLRADGTQTVRFEIPFAVWCHTCQPHAIIGQGVRFNAEKEKIGKYYSTPIWSFRLKHAACGGRIEIRTDPKTTAYVVVVGGKARDYGEEVVREGEGGVPILTAEERERRREDAFAALEGKVEEKAVVKESAKRLQELYEASGRDWEDPWAVNKRVRESFRRERKVRQLEDRATEALKERFATDIEILPGTEEDTTRAKLVSYGETADRREEASSKPVFKTPSRRLQKVKPGKSAKDSRKDALRRQLVSNTRASLNPFG